MLRSLLETFNRGFDSFNECDPVNPRRVPTKDVRPDLIGFWFRGWDVAQLRWKTAVRNRSER